MLKSKLHKRLLPLYLASFFQGFVLWFAIEKVFMTSIGFDATSIAMVVIVLNVTLFLLEIPSGIVADRWSRKGVLIVSALAFIAASLLLGLSDSILEYTLATILFGAHFALLSGTYDSIIYDTLLEETGKRDNYEKYYGYSVLAASAGLVISSLLGGIVASGYGLPAAYLWSIPGGIATIYCLFLFREPTLHQEVVDAQLTRHIKDTFKIVLRKGSFAWLLLAIVSFSLVLQFLLDVDQLWPLALALPLILYGPLNALLLLGYGIGAPLAAKLSKSNLLLAASCVLSIIFTILLTVANMPVIAVAQVGGICVASALITLLSGKLHDTLPSRLRSGSSSAVSTLRTLVFIPLLFGFGFITEKYSVFTAAYMIIPLAVLGVLGIIKLNGLRVNSSVETDHMR